MQFHSAVLPVLYGYRLMQNCQYSSDKTLRLDFAKNDISIEVGFNHGEAIAWNFIKPTLAGELNHVEKAIQTKICIIIIIRNFCIIF